MKHDDKTSQIKEQANPGNRETAVSAADYRLLFESVPDPCLVLDPKLRIVAVNEAYLCVTMTKREEILGRGIFEVFPDNPAEADATGVRNLSASLERVLQKNAADTMAVQKYDIRKPEKEGGGFEERYWSPINTPVFGADNEIAYIIHRVMDVTEFVDLKHQGVAERKLTEELRERAVQMDAEIYARSQEVADANLKLKRANEELEMQKEKLRESEQRFASFMLNLPAAAWMKDLEGKYIYINAEAERVFTAPLFALRGKTNGEVFPPETARQFLENDERVLAEGGSLQTTEVLRQADGIDHHSIVSKFAVPGPDGGPAYVAGVAFDITELKQAEEALRESEEKFSKIFDTAPVGITISTLADGRFVEINKEGERLSGYRRDEVIGRTAREFNIWKDPAERARMIEESQKEGAVRDREMTFRDKEGTILLGLFSAVVIDIGGKKHLLSIVNDITERKKAENLLTGQKRVLEMIATNAPQEETLTALVNFLESGSQGILGSILLLDEDGVHVRHGAAPSLPETYIKAVDGAAIGPRAGSCGTAMFRREPVIVTDIFHDPLWEGYRNLIIPYGLLACWSTPILSHSGRVLGSFAMYYREVRSPAPAEKQLVDIATHIASIAIEHYRAGQEIRKAASAAEAANRAKSQFLSNMSHELRTPMAGVLGMLEIVLGGPLEAEQREFIQTAHDSAGSLVRILNDILEMTRIEAGMLSMENSPFSLPECVAGVVDIFIAEARRKGVDLVLSMADDVPETVVGDQLRLRQVLTNLVGNAFKFTERGKVELAVEALSAVPSGNREVVFTVTDTGIGIPDDKKSLVFRPFRQVDESHSRRYGGSGLGLAISKEIVELMGGAIVFECKDGKGCSFTVTVPFGAPEPTSDTGSGET